MTAPVAGRLTLVGASNMRDFSPEARSWLANYHGSIDATALLLAFEAGRDHPRLTAEERRQAEFDEARRRHAAYIV